MTRSVAEIVGWELVHHERHGYMMRTPDGELWRASKTPTADDLLAWLRERVRSIDMAWNTGGGFTVECVADDTEWTTDAPTLLAAIEAAVRAVAGES